MEEEFRKHLGSRAIISFGSKDDLADGRVVRIENSYVVLGGPSDLLYVPIGIWPMFVLSKPNRNFRPPNLCLRPGAGLCLNRRMESCLRRNQDGKADFVRFALHISASWHSSGRARSEPVGHPWPHPDPIGPNPEWVQLPKSGISIPGEPL